jgi:DNA invertase Pin-like site-specific DNA recombinase
VSPRARPPTLHVDGYVRVSQVRGRKGPRFISPVVQEEEIRGWAASRGAVVLTVFEELDESGLRADRPLLEAAVQRVEDGISEGIVVSKLDRFGRSLLHGLKTVERIRAAGGTFVSVQDGFDVSTDTGKLILRLLLSFAEWDVDRMRSTWEVAQAKAIGRGVQPGKLAPWGYRRTRAGRLRPDPIAGPLVGEVFRMRAAGRSQTEIARFMQTKGVLTSRGNAGWTAAAICNITHNRVYLGEVHWGAYLNAHAHAPLTDPATWEAAQHPNPWRVVGRCPEQMLLCGLVRCASCCMSLRADPYSVPPMYGCRAHSSRGDCPGPAAVRADVLETYVETVVLELLRRRRGPALAAAELAQDKLNAADAALVRYRDSDTVSRVLGEERFTAGLAVRVERVRGARLQVAGLREKAAIHALPPVAELEAGWTDLAISARREVIRSVLDAVFVTPGRELVGSRVFLCPVGTGPRMLPTNGGYKATGPRPFKPGRSTIPPPRGWALYAWPPKRIKADLKRFTRDRTVWPTAEEFRRAGLERLHLQVRLSAGERMWAHHLGLEFPVPSHEELWTDARIRAALALYLPGKECWPVVATFAADGQVPLLSALSRTGGQKRWGPEFPAIRTRRQGQHGRRPTPTTAGSGPVDIGMPDNARRASRT